jgi:predicted DNA-binding transcriptional regulator YafY/transcriptional regulator with XRE-family HTH domain
VTAPTRRGGADANLDSAGQDRDAAQRRELVTQLARRRAAAGLTQAHVAKLMQTSQSAVARLESGRHDTQLSTLARYTGALGLSLDEALRLSVDLTGAAGTSVRGSGDDTPSGAARTLSAGLVSLKQPQPVEPLGPKARLKGRPGQKPRDRGPAVPRQMPDEPGPDHVLTWRQRKVLEVIRESVESRGHPPSLREIGDAVGLTSTSSVSHHLGRLQRAGYLNRDSGRPRTVEVRDRTAVLRVRPGTGFGLRRNAFRVRADGRADGKSWDLVATGFTDMGAMAEYAASFGPDVIVLDPADLREAVIAKLKVSAQEDRSAAKPETAAGGTAPGSTRAGRHVDLLAARAVEAVAGQLGAAIYGRRRVHLRYYSPYTTEEVTDRDVDPIQLLLHKGRTYLYGWCRLREAERYFRLDRILALEELDVAASPPAEAEDFNHDRGRFRPSDRATRVELVLSDRGGWVTDSYTCESVSGLEDGWLSVVLLTWDTSWVRRLALRLGADGRVVSPPVLVAEIRAAARAALANYDGGAAAELGLGGPCPRAIAAAAAGLAG